MVVSRVVLKTKTPLFYIYIYIYIYSLWEIPWVPEVLLAFDATYVHLVKGRLDFPQSRFSPKMPWNFKLLSDWKIIFAENYFAMRCV